MWSFQVNLCILGRKSNRAAITAWQVHPCHGGSPHVHPASGHRGEHLAVNLWQDSGNKLLLKASAWCCRAGELGQWKRVLQRIESGVQHVLLHQETVHPGGWARRGAGLDHITLHYTDINNKEVTCCARFRRLRRPRGDGKLSTSSSKRCEPSSVLRRTSARTELCCRSPTCPISIKCLRGAECDHQMLLFYTSCNFSSVNKCFVWNKTSDEEILE